MSPCVHIYPNLSPHFPHSTFDYKLIKSHSFNCAGGLLYSPPRCYEYAFHLLLWSRSRMVKHRKKTILLGGNTKVDTGQVQQLTGLHSYWGVSLKNTEGNWSEIIQSVIRATDHELLRFASRAEIFPFASASTKALEPNQPLMQWTLDVLPS